MQTIQVVLDDGLLKATDAAARKQKVNRSALIRNALEKHLKELKELELEARDRAGYLKQPQQSEDIQVWDEVAVWPED
jgi:metal-responsive CopG/Arc/MetJ family transcriptional regulator